MFKSKKYEQTTKVCREYLPLLIEPMRVSHNADQSLVARIRAN